MNDEWRDETRIFYFKNDIPKENIFTQIQKLRDKRGDQWFDTPMYAEDCVRVFGYERDILFLTHIANTLMEDQRLSCSEAAARALEDILIAVQLLRDEAAADRYPKRHDIHVTCEKIRAFVSGQAR